MKFAKFYVYFENSFQENNSLVKWFFNNQFQLSGTLLWSCRNKNLIFAIYISGPSKSLTFEEGVGTLAEGGGTTEEEENKKTPDPCCPILCERL